MASEPGSARSFLHPFFDFGTALTPNLVILDSVDLGTEEVAETWVKLAFTNTIAIPLSLEGDRMLRLDAGPGCKLSFVQELIREVEYEDSQPVGIRKRWENSRNW